MDEIKKMKLLKKVLKKSFNKINENNYNLIKELKEIYNEIKEEFTEYYDSDYDYEDEKNYTHNFCPSNIKWRITKIDFVYYKKALVFLDYHGNFQFNKHHITCKYNMKVLIDFSNIYEAFFCKEYIINFCQDKLIEDLLREINKEKYLNKYYDKLPLDIINYTLSYF